MIIPERPTHVITSYNPAAVGCTSCGSQQTVTLCGRYGRRCANCPPWDSLAADGRFTAAWASLRAWLGAAA